MLDHELQLRVGTVATDFFLNLIAVASLVALPVMIPFTTSPALPSTVALSRPLAEVHAEREEADRALAKIETDLAAASDSSAKTDPALVAAATELRVDLARLTAENAESTKRVEQARTAPRVSSIGLPISRDTDKKAIFFILANGLLLPISKDAGRFTGMNVDGGLVAFNPSVPGDPVSSLTQNESLAAKAISAINPNKEFAFIFLRDDSFGGFYQLRGMLQQRGIALGWAPLTTANRQVVFAAGNNGRRPDIQD